MERLTFEGNFCDIAQCRELPCPYNGACSQRKVWERLKAYEETGLTPERCAELRIYDAPRELSDFTGLRDTRFGAATYDIKRAPQSWRYVEAAKEGETA